MINGFEFRTSDNVYFVCAPDLARARLILAEHDHDASMTNAETLPDQMLRFFGLSDGDLIAGRVIRKNGAR